MIEPRNPTINGFKICTKCNQSRPIAHYRANKNIKYKQGSVYPQCKECDKAYNQSRKNRNVEIRRQWYYRNSNGKTANYRRQLMKLYGITLEKYREMCNEQEFCCKICNRFDEHLVVDHCHKTMAVRGLLCRKCNTGIGQFSDDVNLLKSAITYLERDYRLRKANSK